ncbi:hypothetical protein [Leptospira sp. B5-022]|uniref:hypothetical protein n=2 Tax=Leptospira TaxID=171 RepID=UPI0012F6B2AE|nr:hypothetical protein [Leptospira sp. B5-022]
MKNIIAFCLLIFLSSNCFFTKVYPRRESISSSEIIEVKDSTEIKDFYLLTYYIEEYNLKLKIDAFKGKRDLVEEKAREIFRTFYGVKWKSAKESGLSQFDKAGGGENAAGYAILFITATAIILTIDLATLPIRMYPIEQERIINRIIYEKESKLEDINLKGYKLKIFNKDFRKVFSLKKPSLSINFADLNISIETLNNTQYILFDSKGKEVSTGFIVFTEEYLESQNLRKIAINNSESNLLKYCRMEYKNSLNKSLFASVSETSKIEALCKDEVNSDAKEINKFCRCYKTLLKHHHGV